MRRLIGLAGTASLVLLSFACAAGDRTVVAEFDDVGDLVVRANVQQSDAVVGTVRSIDLIERDGRWIGRVEMSLQERALVTRGTGAVVRSTSLLGEKYVDLIVPPDAAGDPPLPEGGVIAASRTSKAPDLEALFSELGAILQTGALEDLAVITTASAMILEGQEDNVGRVLDQTAKLVASLRAQKDALASALDHLSSASKTLADRAGTLERALDVSDDALRVVASQQSELEELVVELDRVGAPLGRLTRAYSDDVDAQVRAVNEIVPKLFEVRDTLSDAVEKLPAFTDLFARAIPGDHVQLDVFVEALPIGSASSSATDGAGDGSLADLMLEAAR